MPLTWAWSLEPSTQDIKEWNPNESMTKTVPINPQKLLLGSHYFVYFGTLGIFLPYFNLFCRHLGFSGFEIGLISSVKTAAVVIFPVLWAMAADRFNARKSILIFCTAMSCLLWLPLFSTRTFLPLFTAVALQSIFHAPIISFIEAFAMDILGKEKKKYGQSRVWGSIAFIVTSMGLGKLLAIHPIDMIIPIMLAGMLVQMLLCLPLPGISRNDSPIFSHALDKSSGEPEKTSAPVNSRGESEKSSYFRSFLSLNTTLFLTAAFLMLASHGAYYGFFSIHMESLGFSTGFIGFAWGVASASEIVIMVFSGSIFSKFTLKNLLLLSFFAAALRWFILFFTQSAPVIILSQLIHAFTYGTFHIASILAVNQLSNKNSATLGQAVNNAVTYGAGMMAGFMISGVFYDDFQGYLFLGSAVCAVAGAIITLFVLFE
ncbi:MAG: MFS transporter [Desulfamplus sp.]|nr:MFS transporter [Desulfamplus sp.]